MKIHLKSIEVRELHDRSYRGLEIQGLSPGLTAVYAPNAAGKSVLALAASRVFSRATVQKNDLILATVEAGKSYDVKLRYGSEAAWPQSTRADLYRLAVVDVIKSDADEDHQKIRDALAGGMNLEAVRGEKPGRFAAPIQAAAGALGDRQKKAREIAESEQEIPRLREELRAATIAREQADLLSRWLLAADQQVSCMDLHQKIKELEGKYPGVDRQSEDGHEVVRQAYERLRNAAGDREQAETAIKQHQGKCAKTALQATDRADVERLQSESSALSGRLVAAGEECAKCKVRLEGASAQLEKYEKRLAPAPLSATDEQALALLKTEALRAATAAEEQKTRWNEAKQARDRAKVDFTNAGGVGAEIQQAIRPADVERAIDLDRDVDDAKAAERLSQKAMEAAKGARDRALEGRPDLRVPAQHAIDYLLAEPSIAALMDDCRQADVFQTVWNAVAQQLDEERDSSIQAARDAEQPLRDWLRAVPQAAQPLRATPLLVCGIAGIALSVLSALLLGTVAGIIATAISIAVVLLAARAMRPTIPGIDFQEQAQARVPAEWKPQAWTSDAVATALASALRAMERDAVRREFHEKCRDRAKGVNTTAATTLAEKLSCLQAETGIAINPNESKDYSLAPLLSRLADVRQATDKLAAATEDYERNRTTRGSLEKQRAQIIHQTLRAPNGIDTGALAKHWTQCLLALRAKEAELTEKELQLQQCCAKSHAASMELKNFFDRFGCRAVGDTNAAVEGFLEWFKTTEAINAAQKHLDQADENRRMLQCNLEQTTAQITRVYGRYGFDGGDNPADRIRVFFDWFAATDRLNGATRNEAHSLSRLRQLLDQYGIPTTANGEQLTLDQRCEECSRRGDEAVPLRRRRLQDLAAAEKDRDRLLGKTNWSDLFTALGLPSEPHRDAVEVQKEMLEGRAAQGGPLQEQIHKSEALIGAAQDANALPAAQEAMNEAISQAGTWLHKRCGQLASDNVIDFIRGLVQAEGTPAIVRRCNDNLESLTGGRYTGIGTAGDVVTILDNSEKTTKRIDQLSTGTRVHLALALRLAVIEASETNGYEFPLLLDEVMATSDPEASRAIAESLRTITKSRQVILFTNQPDDLNILRGVFGEALCVLTLGRTAVPPSEPPIEVAVVAGGPATDGEIPLQSDVSQWPVRVLRSICPELCPRQSHKCSECVEPCPTVFHGISQAAADRKPELQAIADAAETVRARVARASRKLDRAAIADVGWITERFRARVEGVLDECGGDAGRFLKGFCDLDGMRQTNKDACADWLQENGYLDPLPSAAHLRQLAHEKLPVDLRYRGAIAAGICQLFISDRNGNGAT